MVGIIRPPGLNRVNLSAKIRVGGDAVTPPPPPLLPPGSDTPALPTTFVFNCVSRPRAVDERKKEKSFTTQHIVSFYDLFIHSYFSTYIYNYDSQFAIRKNTLMFLNVLLKFHDFCHCTFTDEFIRCSYQFISLIFLSLSS